LLSSFQVRSTIDVRPPLLHEFELIDRFQHAPHSHRATIKIGAPLLSSPAYLTCNSHSPHNHPEHPAVPGSNHHNLYIVIAWGQEEVNFAHQKHTDSLATNFPDSKKSPAYQSDFFLSNLCNS
jgi:hypothetical protein